MGGGMKEGEWKETMEEGSEEETQERKGGKVDGRNRM